MNPASHFRILYVTAWVLFHNITLRKKHKFLFSQPLIDSWADCVLWLWSINESKRRKVRKIYSAFLPRNHLEVKIVAKNYQKVLFTNPSARAGYDTRSIFKRSFQSFPSPRLVASLFTHSWRENKGVHTFPKGICPKVNVIARLEYELAYYDSAVHRFNHYTTRTPIPKGKLYKYFSSLLSTMIRRT